MTTPANLPYRLERSLLIRARPETVFRFFTDPERWASWWGDGSTIDPHPGGRVVIRYPNAVEARGEIIDISAPDRLTFTYGYASGTPIAPGASLVRIQLEATSTGTRLHLVHEFSDAAVRDQHVQGWRYQLSLFANVVSNEVHADAPTRVDDWLNAWSDADSRSRLSTLTRIAAPQVQFSDRYSTVAGLEDLAAHLDATHRFMPGLRLHREGLVHYCQGVATCDWVAISTDGHERARGTNVFVFDADGRVESVTALWNPASEP